MKAPDLIILDPQDTVAVALTDMAAGETRQGVRALEPIARGP